MAKTSTCLACGKPCVAVKDRTGINRRYIWQHFSRLRNLSHAAIPKSGEYDRD